MAASKAIADRLASTTQSILAPTVIIAKGKVTPLAPLHVNGVRRFIEADGNLFPPVPIAAEKPLLHVVRLWMTT